ncbi:MAG: GNAT family N-acetyltransferase [Defluviitaleaceae bacterium]|nr:GNAT family N-acetyltransferase [Defluviitaleaceae bacterium]
MSCYYEKPFCIRAAADGDFERIADCFAQVRGRNNYVANMYEPDFLRNSGKYELFVAVSEGELAGAMGITRDLFCPDSSCDRTLLGLRGDIPTIGQSEKRGNAPNVMCLLSVMPSFLGKGVASALLEHVRDTLRGRDVPAVKAKVVTDSAAVQHILEKLGFTPTGLLLGVKDGINKPIPTNDKNSLAVYVANKAVKDVGVLYIPVGLHAMAEGVYGELGVVVCCMAEASSPCRGRTCPSRVPQDCSVEASTPHDMQGGQSPSLQQNFDEHNKVLYTQILHFDDSTLSALERDGATSIVLLNINHPSAITGFNALQNAGYKFCGFDPLGSTCENVIFYKGLATLAEIKKTDRLEATMKRVFNEF